MFSRKINLHEHFRNRFHALRFPNVEVFNADKDGMISIIKKENPSIIIIPSDYWGEATPFKIGELNKKLQEKKIVVINMVDYSPKKACSFLSNGAKSYVNILSGLKEFYFGLDEISKGRTFISSDVKAQWEINESDKHYDRITKTETEVLGHHYRGRENKDIADVLHISVNTVIKHKQNIIKKFCVDNMQAAVFCAINLDLLDPYEKNHFSYGTESVAS